MHLCAEVSNRAFLAQNRPQKYTKILATGLKLDQEKSFKEKDEQSRFRKKQRRGGVEGSKCIIAPLCRSPRGSADD